MSSIIGVARIFAVGFHSVFTLEADDLFSHSPQYTDYPHKLTTRTRPRPIKNFLQIWFFAPEGGGVHLQLNPRRKGARAPHAYAIPSIVNFA